MKKTLKKALAMIMSVSMLGSLAVPVFAEETAELQPPYTYEELENLITADDVTFWNAMNEAMAFLRETHYINDAYNYSDLEFICRAHKLASRAEAEQGAVSDVSREDMEILFDIYKQEAELYYNNLELANQEKLDFVVDENAENPTRFSSCLKYKDNGVRELTVADFENYFETKTVDGVNYITLDGVDYEYYITEDGEDIYFECAYLFPPLMFQIGGLPPEYIMEIDLSDEKKHELDMILYKNGWISSIMWYDFFKSDYNRFNYYVYNRDYVTGEFNHTSYEEVVLGYFLYINDMIQTGFPIGDIDGDMEIEITSIEQLLPKCDIDGDGTVEYIDVDTYLENIDRIENINLDDRWINLVEDSSIQDILQENETLLSGDVNIDGAIDVLDLGTLKLFITKQTDFTEIQNYMATGDTTTAPDVRNVTKMNQYLIKLVDEY